MDLKNLVARAKSLNERSILVALFMLVLTFGQYASGPAAQCLMFAVLFPWCICLIAKKRFEEGFEKNATFKWVCASLIVFVLSTFVTMTAGSSWPQSVLTLLCCSLFFLFVPKQHGVKEIRRELLAIGSMMVCLYLPFELLALLSVFTGKVIRLPVFPNVVGISQAGSVADRIRIFTNTNTVAIYAVVNMLFSLYAICACRKKMVKAFFVFAIAVNYVALAHTQSRTSSIAFSAAVAAIALRGVCLMLREKKWRWLAGAVAAAAAFFIVLNGVNVIYKADVKLAYRLTAEDTAEVADVESPIDRKGQFDVSSSGRGAIWTSTIKYLKDHPSSLVLGEGQVNAIKILGEEYPEIAHYMNIHNSYLAAVFYCGLPFLICLLGFLCTLVVPAVRILLQPEREETRGNFIVPVMIGLLLIIGVGEELLFMIPCYPNVLLYLMGGYLLKFEQLEKGNTDEN